MSYDINNAWANAIPGSNQPILPLVSVDKNGRIAYTLTQAVHSSHGSAEQPVHTNSGDQGGHGALNDGSNLIDQAQPSVEESPSMSQSSIEEPPSILLPDTMQSLEDLSRPNGVPVQRDTEDAIEAREASLQTEAVPEAEDHPGLLLDSIRMEPVSQISNRPSESSLEPPRVVDADEEQDRQDEGQSEDAQCSHDQQLMGLSQDAKMGNLSPDPEGQQPSSPVLQDAQADSPLSDEELSDREASVIDKESADLPEADRQGSPGDDPEEEPPSPLSDSAEDSDSNNSDSEGLSRELPVSLQLAPTARAKRRAATAAMANVKSFIAKEGASDTVALEEGSPYAVRGRKKRKTSEPVTVPVKLETSIDTLSVPVLVKSEDGDDMIRISGAESLKAHGLTGQSIFASALLKDLSTRSVKARTDLDSNSSLQVHFAENQSNGNGVAKKPFKLDRKTMQALRLRPDGTPKRKYTRKTPAANQAPIAKLEGKKGTRNAAGQEACKGPGRGRAQRQGAGRGRGWRGQQTPSSPDVTEESSSEDDSEPEPESTPVDEDDEGPCDELFGCSSCQWKFDGCAACQQESPVMKRPKAARWQPAGGRPQEEIPEAPTFYPTEGEFADPISYINKIREHGERAGIACIVPPQGWAPPFALDKGTNGQAADSFRFSIRKQPTWQLCMRPPNPSTTGPLRSSAAGRVDAEIPKQEDESQVQAVADSDATGFGFVTLDKTHTLASFQAYAKWAKDLHFGLNDGEEGPSVDEIEAEFWRIVETPGEVVESLYGQDLDSGHHGSGFPLPPSRKRQLEELLAQKHHSQAESSDESDASMQTRINYTPEEQAYSEHCWNINNLPRCKGSILRYVIGEELITGVMVPWLYVGSCMSAFCWHIEDHALYSINYLHKGAPKIWYGVPSNASEALENALKDAFPEHFKTAPDLMYQLVTMLSPAQLKARNVPVHRVVHKEGSFVITFPNAYHSGFNSGFNCAEAVNFAPPDWLPWGCNILNKYRRDGKAATLSSDALLVALVKGAPEVHEAAQKAAQPHSQQPDNESSLAEGATDQGATEMDWAAAEEPEGTRDPAAQIAWDIYKQGQKRRQQAALAEAAHSPMSHQSKPDHTPASNVPGQRADISFLDAIKVEDAPAHAVRLAAAELRLRVAEERERRKAGLSDHPSLKTLKMTGQPGDKDEQGLWSNTEDMDCQNCKCDLWLSAVVSRDCPDQHFCPEHACQLKCPEESWILLQRYTLEELDDMLDQAEQILGGVNEAKAIIERVHNPPQVELKKLGPVANLIPQVAANASLGGSGSLPPSKRASLKRERKPVIKTEKIEEKSEDGLKSEVSHYSPNDSRKRPRRGIKAEEGPTPKKLSRGPGKRAVTLTVNTDPANKEDGSKDGSDSEGWSPMVDAGAVDEDSDSPDKRGRGRGKGRGRGRGRGEGRGRGRGRKQAQVRKPSTESSDVPPASKAALKEEEEPKEVSPEPSSEADALDNSTPESSRSASPISIDDDTSQDQPSTHQAKTNADEKLSDSPESAPEPEEQFGGPTEEAAPPSVTPGGVPLPGSLAGNTSVLMDILRASAACQPQGHVTHGSIPRPPASGH